MKKRILSILLTLCMVLCLMPTAVFAEGNEDTPTQALSERFRYYLPQTGGRQKDRRWLGSIRQWLDVP